MWVYTRERGLERRGREAADGPHHSQMRASLSSVQPFRVLSRSRQSFLVLQRDSLGLGESMLMVLAQSLGSCIFGFAMGPEVPWGSTFRLVVFIGLSLHVLTWAHVV